MIRSFPPSFADCRRQPTRRRRAPQPTSRRDFNQWPSTPRPINFEQTKTSHRGLSSSRIEREPILEAFQFSNKRDHMPLRKAQAPVGATQRLRAAVPRTRSERHTRPKAPTRGRRKRFLPTCDGAFGRVAATRLTCPGWPPPRSSPRPRGRGTCRLSSPA